jgi:DNA-binding NarL/FixJ family response regulator
MGMAPAPIQHVLKGRGEARPGAAPSAPHQASGEQVSSRRFPTVSASEGRSNLTIAELLHVSVKTVEMHVAAVFRALDLEAAPDLNLRVLAALAFFGRD